MFCHSEAVVSIAKQSRILDKIGTEESQRSFPPVVRDPEGSSDPEREPKADPEREPKADPEREADRRSAQDDLS